MSLPGQGTVAIAWRYPVKSMMGEEQAIAKNSIFVPFAGEALPCVGVYAKATTGGTLRRGDAVRIA